jgi:hypothetical protein
MQDTTDPINKLLTFRSRDKFSDENWEVRGLIPSDPDLSNKMDLLFNQVADVLIEILNHDPKEKQLKGILKSGLKKFNKTDYDTEEREFICDLFQELSDIVNIDIKADLNNWLYGALFSTLQKLSKIINPERIIETIAQPCNKCGTQLETYIKKKQEGIPDSTWLVAKCSSCNELNLLSPGPNVKELKFGNYECIDYLNKEEYSYEQALTRLEQIKFFRN